MLISNTFFADHLVLVRQMTQGGVRLRAFLGVFGMEFPDVIRSLGPAAEGPDVMTPMERVRFDERGDPVSYERVILQIQDGRHVAVWPKERAQAAAR